MKPFYKNLKFIAVGLLTFLGVCISTISAQTSITSIGVPVTENFNTFTPAGAWSNGSSPLSNWYALGNSIIPTNFILNNGSTTSSPNPLSSFGSTGSGDRAIGFIPVGTTGAAHYYGWRLKNNMLTTIYSLSVSWTLEQWRKVNTGAQSLQIFYQISSSPITQITPGSLFNPVLSASSPQFSSGTSVLDGNSVKVNVTNVIPVEIPPGSEILICWLNTKSSANHLMAIDDVSVTAKSDQTISFGTISKKIYGDPNFNLIASASSGLTPITFTSSNEDVATISNGNQVTLVGPGSSTITANQAGNSYYNAASFSQGLNVSPTPPIASNATAISPTAFTANWTASNGLNDNNVTYVIEYSIDKTFETDYDFYEPTLKSQQIDQYMGFGLTPNTVYYYRIYSLSDGNYSTYSQSSAITTGTDYVTINTGNWDTGDNWDVGNINDIANSITIRHPITLNTVRDSVVTNKLVIESTGKLTTNQKIYITNELVIEVAGDGSAGQILNTNNIVVGENAKITVRKTFTPGEWSFIGFPFTVTSDNVFNSANGAALTWGNLNSGANYIVQQYDGADRALDGTAEYVGAGLHWANVSPKEFTAKKGYIVYNNTSNVIDFTSRGSNIGTYFSRTGATVPTVRYPSTNEHAHWNLVSSPLSSKYNLGSTSPATSYYAYNGIIYMSVLPGETLDVQPFASFFLQAPSTSISFANGGRKVIAASRKEEIPVDEIYLNLSNGNVTYDDMTRIRLQEGAAANYEIGTDAAKMFGMNIKVSYIYTTINKTTASINTLPKTVTEVELITKFAAAGKYSISISNIEKVQNYSAVILIDISTGKRTDLLAVGSYDYNVSAAGTSNRFKVQFAPKITTGVSVSDDHSLTITSQHSQAIISGLSAATQVRVYDTTGKAVFSGLVNNNEPIKLENKGLYIFEIATPEKTEKIKSFIR
jgi:hypothetical protein